MSMAPDVQITNEKAAKESQHTLKQKQDYHVYSTLYFYFLTHVGSEYSRLEIQLTLNNWIIQSWFIQS